MVGRWRATVPLALTLAGVLSARPAAAQWAQLASGTNTTGVVQRFYLNPTSCEADPCILACTSLLINSFSSTTSGSHTTYINPYILPGSLPEGCSCDTSCSATLAPSTTNGTADTFDATLIKDYGARSSLNLTLTCSSGMQITSSIVSSFAQDLKQIDIQFPAGFAGSSVSCTGSYAVLPLSPSIPPRDWFLGLSYTECVDPPLGVAQQVQLAPGGCSSDPCLAACSGRTNGLLYFNPRGQFRFYYQWLLQPSPGATIPQGCSCDKYNCMFVTNASIGFVARNSGDVLRAFHALAEPVLTGDGAPFYCSGRNSTTAGNPPDFKVGITSFGAKKGITVRFAAGCSAVYAVTAGLVFNVTQKSSIPLLPLPLPAPPRDVRNELSDSTKITIIVVVVVVGSLLLCLCGLLFYMYRRERRGEPLFTKLEELEMEGGVWRQSSKVEPGGIA